jgi:ferric-dicitrate binding protein FerR (iron transport regulator)
MSPDLQQELEHLLSALCDDALSDAEHRRLEQLLETDPECRRCYLEYMDVHACLFVHPQFSSLNVPADTAAVLPMPGATSGTAACTPAPRRVLRPVLRYGIVAASAVAASILVQVLWLHPQTINHAERGKTPAEVGLAGSIATLIQAADCTWEGATAGPRVGCRLQPGTLQLQTGQARILFDSGTELILEGPADLRLHSSTSATLALGKALLRADETASSLELQTPSAVLIELGTEYGVSVGADGEMLQVYEGEVQRMPRKPGEVAPPEYVKAGEARRARRGAFASQPIAFDAARFVRRVAAPAGQGAAGGLLAYEGFDYKAPDAFATGMANGGQGWASPWSVSAARPFLWGDKKLPPLNVEENLVRPDSVVPSVGGRFDHGGFGIYYRQLATPIRMDTDGVYYISFLLRRAGPTAHPQNIVALMLRPDEDPAIVRQFPDHTAPVADIAKRHHEHGEGRAKPDLCNRLMIGVGGCNQVFTRLGHDCARASLPIASGVTYLFVAKIVAGGSSGDQVFVRVYGPREPTGSDEPASWTVVSPAVHSNLTFSWLGIHVNSKNRQMLDEIRVGSTWSSVTLPWTTMPAPKQKKT